jgi:DNA repair protein SbcD/Mre11
MTRFLHLADTHLGSRHPGRGPGDPYLRNLDLALAPAREGRVHLVIHAGDCFNRSRPPPRLLAEAAAAFTAAAEGGAHVVVVPGNHERSIQPARLLLTHPRIHVIESPKTVRLDLDGRDVSIFGFPFVRRDPRGKFEAVLRATGWPRGRGEVDLFTCHQTFDGAAVGPANYTFRYGPDVIPRAFLPREFAYAALGHIHRYQLLPHPDEPSLLFAYPGATERTSRAERDEEKGYLGGTIGRDGYVGTTFNGLPSDPIVRFAPLLGCEYPN